MGCDIHIHIEYKVGDQPWQADRHHKREVEEDDDGSVRISQVTHSSRDYELFGNLAGVRGSGGKAIGLPEDCSEIIKTSTDQSNKFGDDHSHSYSSLKEFKSALYKSGYDLSTKCLPEAFGTWNMDRKSYENIVAYCEEEVKRLTDDLEIDQILLGQQMNTEVKCRLVYWFDN